VGLEPARDYVKGKHIGGQALDLRVGEADSAQRLTLLAVGFGLRQADPVKDFGDVWYVLADVIDDL
jgi:hypothetical protein